MLEDEKISKVGIATKQDLKELKESGDFEPKGFIDLNKEAPRYGYESVGVKNLSAMILGFRVSKRQQTSNWEAPQLTEAQIRYAATDAWVCREIYLRMKNSLFLRIRVVFPGYKMNLIIISIVVTQEFFPTFNSFFFGQVAF